VSPSGPGYGGSGYNNYPLPDKGGGGDGGQSAVPNTGGGGGGNGNGGSGVVIMSILTSLYSGVTTGAPAVTTVGDRTVLQFNQSGSYTA
jgi:hypothetical protein